MVRMMLVFSLASSPPAEQDPTKARPATAESSHVFIRDKALHRRVVKTCLKEVTYTVHVRGQAIQKVKKIPYTITYIKPVGLPLEQVEAFDRRGRHVAPSLLPGLIKGGLPVLIVPGPKEVAAALKSMKEERLLLVLPPPNPR
jgi:hypothetical protein